MNFLGGYGGYHGYGGYGGPAVVGGYGVSKVVTPYAAAAPVASVAYGGYGHGAYTSFLHISSLFFAPLHQDGIGSVRKINVVKKI